MHSQKFTQLIQDTLCNCCKIYHSSAIAARYIIVVEIAAVKLDARSLGYNGNVRLDFCFAIVVQKWNNSYMKVLRNELDFVFKKFGFYFWFGCLEIFRMCSHMLESYISWLLYSVCANIPFPLLVNNLTYLQQHGRAAWRRMLGLRTRRRATRRRTSARTQPLVRPPRRPRAHPWPAHRTQKRKWHFLNIQCCFYGSADPGPPSDLCFAKQGFSISTNERIFL